MTFHVIRHSGRRKNSPFFRRPFCCASFARMPTRLAPACRHERFALPATQPQPFRRFIVGRREDDAVELNGLFRFEEPDRRDALAEESLSTATGIRLVQRSRKGSTAQACFAHRPGGACWFRNDADEVLAAAERLAAILRQRGNPVRFDRERSPWPNRLFRRASDVTRRPLPGRRRDCYSELSDSRSLANAWTPGLSG